MIIGYVRVSTQEQNTARQEVLMEELKADKVFIDKLSGKNTDRPQLQEMLDFAREGDSIVVESISRIARNTKDLLDIVDTLTAKGVVFVSKKEAIDTTTPTGQFMLTVFGAIAQLERAYILERQAEGVALAKAEGRYKGRVPIKIDEELFAKEYEAWKRGDTGPRYIMKRLGIKTNTFYRRVRAYEAERGIVPTQQIDDKTE